MSTTAKLYLIESDGLAEWLDPITGSGKTDPTKRPRSTQRSLLVEQEGTYILIEAGLGIFDLLAPRRRLGRFLLPGGATNRRTVRQRLEQRGLSPDRVEHIVVTHLHLDNIGAISDFPTAKVHAWPGPSTTTILEAPPRLAHRLVQRDRYVAPRPEQADWYGFRAHRVDIDALELHLIELPGHTREHAGVVLRVGSGYVVHLGHALLSLDELLRPMLPASAVQWGRVLNDERPFEAITTRDRLRKLARQPTSALTFVCGRGKDTILSLGPHPYPDIEIL